MSRPFLGRSVRMRNKRHYTTRKPYSIAGVTKRNGYYTVRHLYIDAMAGCFNYQPLKSACKTIELRTQRLH